MWVNAQRDGRPAKYRWRPLQKFNNSIPCTTLQSLADAPAGVLCSKAARTGERKTWTQSEFCMSRILSGARAPKNVYMVYQPRRWPKIMQSSVGLQ